MRRVLVSMAAVIAAASLVVVGCGQAAPTPAPTSAPAAPTKAAEPTKAPAAATKAPAAAKPTAAPAKKVDYPAKGKTITWIAPWTGGSAFDGAARLMVEMMEKDLATVITFVNRPGAGLQVGFTELAQSKPDGYTAGYTIIPNIVSIYLDPERQALFSRKSYAPVGLHVFAPNIVAVKGDSPYKTLKDLLDASKANPEKITATTTGILSDDHLGLLELEKITGAKFAAVHTTGVPLQLSSLLGGHTHVAVDNVGDFRDQVKTGEIRVLAILDREESKYYPGVKTAEAQGFKVYSAAARGVSVAAGTPREIVEILSGAMKRAIESPAYRERLDQIGIPLRYMGPAEFAKYWEDAEPGLKQLVDEAKEQLKK